MKKIPRIRFFLVPVDFPQAGSGTPPEVNSIRAFEAQPRFRM